MALRVIYKPTGQLGEIPDDKFDPNLFERADVQGAQTQAPQRQDLASNVGSFLLNTLLKPAVDYGKFVGAGLVQAPILGLTGGKVNIPIMSEEELQRVAGGRTVGERAAKALPAAAKRTAGAASYLIPFGRGASVLSKILAPGAAVGALQGISEEGATPQSVVGQAGLGATGAGALTGLLKLPGVTTKIAGKGLEKTGENLALRSLRPTPSQLTRFEQETGEDLGKFLISRKLGGADYSKILQHTEKLQSEFDKIALSKDLQINPNDIINKFVKEVDRLNKSILPTDRTKAQTLQNIALNFIDRFGNNTITAKALTQLRRDVDEGITKFNLDEAVKGPLNLVRDVIQDTIREAADRAGLKIAGKNLKDTGVELSKLYKALSIAERQENLGRGSLPIGLTTLLGMTTGGLLPGGLLGVITGGAAAKAINTPSVLSTLSRGASGAGAGLQDVSGVLSRILGISPQITGQVGARTPQLITPNQRGPNYYEGQQESANRFQQSNLPPTSPIAQQPIASQEPILSPGGQWRWDEQAQDWVPNEQQQGAGVSKEAFQQAMIQDLATGGKNISKLKTIYDILFPKQEDKQANATIQERRALGNSGLRALQDLQRTLELDQSVLFKQLTPGKYFSRQYEAAGFRLADAILRLRTGATAPEEEIRRYMQQIVPRFGDDARTIQFKLEQAQLDLQDALNQSGQ